MMQTNSDYLKDRKFKQDFTIFGSELFNFVFVRRGLCSVIKVEEIVELRQPYEDSEFTEEVGKALLVIWHKYVDSFRRKLSDDFPKYLPIVDNLKKYVWIHRTICDDGGCNSFEDQFLCLTAFMLEASYYSFEKMKEKTPLLSCHIVWIKMFAPMLYELFTDPCYGWRRFRWKCLEISKQYDKAQVEKDLGGCMSEFSLHYFLPKDGQKSVKSLSRRQRVSRYYTLDDKTGSKILPAGLRPRPRPDIPTVKPVCDTKADFNPTDFTFARYVYVKIRKMGMLPEHVAQFRCGHSEAKRNRAAEFRAVEVETADRREIISGPLNFCRGFLTEVQGNTFGMRKKQVSRLEGNYIKFVRKKAARGTSASKSA